MELKQCDQSAIPRTVITCWFVMLLSLNLPAAAAESGTGSFKLSGGVEYTTGNYGGSKDVEEWYVPLTAKYLTGPYVLRLTIPYIEVKAPSGTVVSGGSGGEVLAPGTGPRKTEEGLGDIIAGVTYRDLLATEDSMDLAVDLTGKIKFGTADEDKGLGTGEHDFTVKADIFRFMNPLTPFASLGYRFRGDPPGTNLDNGWILMFGTMYDVSEDLGWSVDYYFSEASSRASDDPQELSAALDYKLGKTENLQGYVIKGLSDGSPDWGIGVTLTIRH